jgi:hypothetical protein
MAFNEKLQLENVKTLFLRFFGFYAIVALSAENRGRAGGEEGWRTERVGRDGDGIRKGQKTRRTLILLYLYRE